MNFVVPGRDGEGGEARARERAGHLLHVERHQDQIVYAGPLLEGSRMVGSLFVFDVPDRAALDSHLADHPCFNPGIFQSVEIRESRRMAPEREPGFLAAEAERAKGGRSLAAPLG